MNKLYYVDVKLFDTFEETSSVVRKAVIAENEETARSIVSKMLEDEINDINASCANYEIINIRFIREV